MAWNPVAMLVSPPFSFWSAMTSAVRVGNSLGLLMIPAEGSPST
jgi:hypothetical protein